MSNGAPVLRLDGVAIQRARQTVVEDVSLTLGAHERICIEGENGAGKSSLLLALLGFLPIAAGRIELLGRECRDEADFAAVRGPVALLFQDSDDQLFCSTVAEDVAFGPRNLGLDASAASARAAEALDTIGIGALRERPIDALSGGEKRLVALAGLLAMRPRVLLLDEPTANLAPSAVERVLGALAPLDVAMLIVTHERGVAPALGARTQYLLQGRLVDAQRA